MKMMIIFHCLIAWVLSWSLLTSLVEVQDKKYEA